MFYYKIGQTAKRKKTRFIILQSEVEIPNKRPMIEEDAISLLQKYADEDRVFELKKMLADTDYIACKIAEGAATAEEYAEEIAQRQAWREEINRLVSDESELQTES